ncbi:DNA polymerase III subunit gamma/tau [Hymenobacter sp. UV11]|uniref:DNA polymerase III subunit gamma/tau n=1 Tax=Hymenobacter sp. UV11 TaxID=1849735 RepID=UPI00105F6A28|nr:DNA polymerase III subunit gamma/tau [Hymenobacter sp. UV11]TDN35771.1 DNA polymerase III, subunit gamma and tau [Hymenobacter sp. UV11]TFZ67375.1 DNA polymerase III subunit gamma/tau [Hymenobacter sp. UV11]
MENFVVSARKYRPATFRSVVGQQHVTTTLQNAIQSQHLAQAFLFCGPRGVGKTTCARILAKTINCTNLTPEAEACGVCTSCVAFQENASFNVHELDAASNNSVEDIRSLVEQVRYAPQQGRFKIYIIDEVHMLSNAAFNAFLKTLEEPPSYAIFILATTERHKIIPTILSRCQIFDFNRIKVEDIREHLRYVATSEGVAADDDALHLLAQKADGGLRDALSMFDQQVTFAGNNLTYKEVVQNLHILDYDYYFRLVDALLHENLSAALLLLDSVMQQGFDLHNFVVGTAEHLRGLLVCKDPVTVQLLEVSDNIRQQYVRQAQAAPLPFLLSALNLVSQCDREFKQAKNQRLHVELTLMKLAYLNGAVQFVRDLTPGSTQRSSADNGEAKKKTSSLAAAPTPPLPAQAAPSAAPAAEPETNAPADGPEPLPVENGVRELHPTPSIEPEAAAPVTERHLVRDTLPHVETGRPSMQGLEPTQRPTDVRPGTIAAPSPATALPKLPGLPTLPGRLPGLRDVGTPSAASTSASQKAATQAQEPTALTTGPLPPIAPELLQAVWKQLTDERRAQEKMSDYMVLNRAISADEGHVITLTVDNPVQVVQFNDFRAEFMAELRRRTGHPGLTVQIEVATAAPTGRKLYTSNDKFAYLAEKYPALQEMKQRLGLDADF